MRNLLESSDQTTTARRNREVSKPNSSANRKINEFWQHARRLHGALSKAWQCGCTSHTANLQLQHRTSEQVEFDVFFDVGSVSGNDWRGTKIKMLNDITTDIVGVTKSVPQRAPAQRTRQVRWATQSNQVSQISSQSNMAKISCLCSTLSQTCPGCFGFLDEDKYRFMIYPRDQAVSVIGLETITLEDLLSNANYTLTRRKRYWLALTLASSYLQLYSTPWLATPLQKNSILFLHNPSSDGSILLDSPYVRGDMSNKAVTGAGTMATLGIWLLELCFGTSLENNKFRQQLPPGDSNSAPILDYAAALQWSKMVGEEAGPEFAEAVEWCLHTKDPGDGSWRRDIWTHVIAPLDYCHKQVSQRLTAC